MTMLFFHILTFCHSIVRAKIDNMLLLIMFHLDQMKLRNKFHGHLKFVMFNNNMIIILI